MAKKAAGRRATREGERFDDDKYGKPLYSLAYEMDELALSRAAGFWFPTYLRNIVLGVAMAALLGLVALLMTSPNNYVPAGILLVVSIAASEVVNRWHQVESHFARKSNLGAVGVSNRLHVVVLEDRVVVEGPDDRVLELRLAGLRSVEADEDACLAKFADGNAVLFPRVSMSENRFRALVSFLRECLAAR